MGQLVVCFDTKLVGSYLSLEVFETVDYELFNFILHSKIKVIWLHELASTVLIVYKNTTCKNKTTQISTF